MMGDGHPPFIVAEVGVNHNGSVDTALSMIDIAADCGVDAVKFGVFKADEFCRKNDPLYETFKRCELPDESWAALKTRCEKRDVIFFATPQNEGDFDVLRRVGVPCVKVGSDDLANTRLITSYAKHGLPMILSSGMADWRDIWKARTTAMKAGCRDIAVLVCTSEYPCPPGHANIARVTTLRWKLPTCPIGFSDHTEGSQAAVVAASLGACYFEKHFTLHHAMIGPDHAFSAEPDELREWVQSIKRTAVLMGSGRVEPSQDELKNRVMWRRTSGQQLRGVA